MAGLLGGRVSDLYGYRQRVLLGRKKVVFLDVDQAVSGEMG
jgi:hypothetical protein